MNNSPNKYTELISRLSDKTECYNCIGRGKVEILGCYLPCVKCEGKKVLQLPVRIGDVLHEIKEKNWSMHYTLEESKRLYLAWYSCGLKKSLQEIYSNAGIWNYLEMHEATGNFPLVMSRKNKEVLENRYLLKKPEAEALFQELFKLFPKPPSE